MKPDLADIKNIIFDLGNVLLNLDFNASINAFKELGMDGKVVNKQQAYSDPVFHDFETGSISPEVFRKRVRKLVDNENATDQQIDDAWYAMILDIPPHRVKMVQELRKNYNVYLFSNTNQIHIERLHKQFKNHYDFDFSSLFVKDFYSHELGASKPAPESYQKVIDLSGVNPAESIFIDDLERNVKGAEKAGLKTFWLNNGRDITEVL